MTVKVGSAYGEMLLRYDQFIRGADLVEARLRKLQQAVARPIVAGVGGEQTTALTTQSAAARRALTDFDRLDRQYNQLRDSEIRAARASGDHKRALQLINSELRSTQPNTVRYNNLLAQQAQVARQAGGALGQFKDALGAAGVALGVHQLIQYGADATRMALALREAKNSLQAVAGSAQLYGEALATARQQQLLFGGSLQENIDGIQGLTIVSRESGASLAQLVDLTQRLQLKSPEQGVGGARIAITEALSGNVRSLARRFEIPADKLRELGDTSLPVAARLQVIDAYLGNIGITAEAVAGRVDQDALAFRHLNAELEQTKIRAGNDLASTFSRSAEGLARIIGLVNNNPEAIAQLKALASANIFGTGTTTVKAEDIERERRAAAEREAGNLLGGGFLGAGGQIVKAGGLASYKELTATLTELQLRNAEAADASANLTRQFVAGAINVDQYRAALAAIGNTAQGLSSPYSAAATAAGELTTALGKQVLQTLDANAEAEKQRQIMARIAGQAGLVQKGLITEANAIAILRRELGSAADEALRLQLELGRAASISAQKDAPLTSAEKSFIDRANAMGPQDASARLKEEQEFRRAQAQYQKDLLQFSPLSTQIAAKQKELARLGADDPKRFAVQLDIRRLQEQLENERLRTAKGHTSELDKQLRLSESIYDSEQKRYRAAIDAQLALNDDAKQDILDQDKARRLQNTINNARDPRIRALAQLDLARIPLENAKREADIAQQQSTAGAPIINGKTYQSLAGQGRAGQPTAPPSGPGAPGVAAAGIEGGNIDITLSIDGHVLGNILLPIMSPQIAGQLYAAWQQSRAGGGGEATA